MIETSALLPLLVAFFAVAVAAVVTAVAGVAVAIRDARRGCSVVVLGDTAPAGVSRAA